jgi:hypothetical protein
MTEIDRSGGAKAILATVKPLAAEYYRLTGRPLGMTAEVGEMEVASLFGMTLAPARAEGVDALRGEERVQIKTRAIDPRFKSLGRMSRISVDKPCDTVMLAMLDQTFNLIEVWEAPFIKVVEELGRPGSKQGNAVNLACQSSRASLDVHGRMGRRQKVSTSDGWEMQRNLAARPPKRERRRRSQALSMGSASDGASDGSRWAVSFRVASSSLPLRSCLITNGPAGQLMGFPGPIA